MRAEVVFRVVALSLILLLGSLACDSGKQLDESTGSVMAPTAPVAASITTDSAGDAPRHGGVVFVSYGGGTPRHFNPALVSGSSTAIVGAQIFASPVRYDEKWNPQPYLARSWSVSEDGLAVTLHLAEDATFHDGQPITSADVAFSLNVVKEHHPFKSMFAPVEGVETPDPHTAVIRLSQPHPAILLAMSPALLPILPEHVYGDGQDLETHPANMAPVGSGPFRLVEYVPDESIVLERYENYFLPDLPYLDGLVIRLETDPKAQVVDMERREANLLAVFTDFDGLARLSECEYLTITQQGYEGLGPINWLAFNLLREPLDDRRVRQAIAYAVDPDFIIGRLHQGRTQRAAGPISPGSPFYVDDLPLYNVDLDRANRLLDEAGHPVQPDGKRFSLTLDYIPAVPSQQRDIALYLERQLAQIGVDVQVRRSASFPEWAERIGNWEFDMTMDIVYNWGDPVIGVHRTYLSDNIRKGVVWSNTQNYRNPRVDEILAQAEVELDENRRRALYREFQQIVTEELPIVWINVLPFYTVYDTALGNPPLSIWGVHSPLDELYWKELPATARVLIPTPEDGQAESAVQEVAMQAMALIEQVGLYAAQKVFRDPGQGFLDLEGTGLHVIGFTREGTVFLDNSGQMKPGMDISGLLDLDGNKLLPRFLDAARGLNGGLVSLEGIWPHPTTQEVGPVSAWCGFLGEQDVICGMVWSSDEGGSE